jgi:serine/threonine-protein kinase
MTVTIKPVGGGSAILPAHFSGPADPTILLTYHNALGMPLAQYEIPPAVEELCWSAHYKIQKLLGKGAQGVVYLAKREGVDGYHTHVALKIFPRPTKWSEEEYVGEMRRIACQAQRVGQIQHDNLVSIRDFVAIDQNRVMVLEWVDGLDLAQLLDRKRMEELRARLLPAVWAHLNNVIVTPGRDHCRLKPGIAVDILRGCLAGLSSLHHKGIVHCDLKPSNIMIKRTGTKKIVDIDSSCVLIEDQPHLRGTPYYMAPEQLRGKPVRLRSDIASLGYILIEILTGQQLFGHCQSMDQLLEAKLNLPSRLHQILPEEVRRNAILSALVRKMVAVDPKDRFPDADAADLEPDGAASFLRHLVKTDLSTEYDRELAWWFDLLNHERG